MSGQRNGNTAKKDLDEIEAVNLDDEWVLSIFILDLFFV